MIPVSPSTRIFVSVDPADMRKSFNGLATLVSGVIEEDPLSGHLFCFSNRRRNLLKIIFWDGTGLWVLAKRLEKGTFSWPIPGSSKKRAIGHEQLSALIGGLDFEKAKRRRWYGREKARA